MEDSSHPLDMSSKVTHHIQPNLYPEQSPPSHPETPCLSPPPLTKIVKKTPSSPREFFAKLYGPDTNHNQDTSKKPTNPIQNTESPSHYSPPSVLSFPLPSYLPTSPLPPHHHGGIMTLENIPFPAGLAAFCK